LRIRVCDLFYFAFYKVISTLWLGSRVWLVHSGWLEWFFVSFFNYYFFQFHPATLYWLESELHNLFWIYSMWLSLSHDSGLTGKLGLTWIIFLIEFCFQFHSLTLDWLKFRFNYFFYLLLIGLSRSHDLDQRFSRLTWVDSSTVESIQYIIVSIFKKTYCFDFFLIKVYFYQSFRLFWTWKFN